jgi:hypothetical protein
MKKLIGLTVVLVALVFTGCDSIGSETCVCTYKWSGTGAEYLDNYTETVDNPTLGRCSDFDDSATTSGLTLSVSCK